MKTFFTSLAALAAIGMFTTANLSADEKSPGGGAGVSVGGGHAGVSVGGGGGAGVNVRAGGDAARANVQAGGDAARANVQAAPNRGRVDVDVNRGRVGADVNRNRNLDGVRANVNVRTPRQDYLVERGNRIGDRDFDRHGIGIVDDRAFRDRGDNRWRYRNWNNEWWYWLPGGYWSYWRGDRWNRYEPDSYIAYNDYNATPTPAVTANYNGPYYEDQNGFYSMDQQGQRVYDPQIQRVGVAGAAGPVAR